jgi:NhaP-type Na+/H+ or K+/H+ antiporter
LNFLFAFGALLIANSLLSERATRSVYSNAAIVLLAGVVLGPGAVNLLRTPLEDPNLEHFIELVVFAIRFSDGMRMPVGKLLGNGCLGGRVLLIGLPITLLGVSLSAVPLLNIDWPLALCSRRRSLRPNLCSPGGCPTHQSPATRARAA